MSSWKQKVSLGVFIVEGSSAKYVAVILALALAMAIAVPPLMPLVEHLLK